MKTVIFSAAMIASTFLFAGCNKTEQVADAPAKNEQEVKEQKDIMRFNVQPKPDPSKYSKDTF